MNAHQEAANGTNGSAGSREHKSNSAALFKAANIPTCQYKLVLLGDSAVGKSSLVLKFVKGQFFEYQESTVGAAHMQKEINLKDKVAKFEIWDTAGQERYHSLAPMYYRGAAAAVVVYDITSRASFQRAKAWVMELRNQMKDSAVQIAFVGNKCDMEEERQVETDEAKQYTEEKNLLFLECSAKKNINVREIFETLAAKLPITEGNTKSSSIVLDPQEAADQTSQSCCR